MPKMPKMPIDVMAVLQEATDVEAARSVPLCVSVLLDDTAPDDLTAFVRSSFASASPQARVSVNYFEDAHIAFDARSDMAVIGCRFHAGNRRNRLSSSRRRHSRYGRHDAS